MPPSTKKTQLVGILNCTPDSYFEGGRHAHTPAAIEHALKLFDDGADIVDIGGESTRPGATHVSAAEELDRVIPVIEGIRKHIDLPLSIDTYKPEVARAALRAGATMLNDINGAADPKMRQIAAETGAHIVVMHRGRGIIRDICTFFRTQTDALIAAGVAREKIILDPGIGGGSFGKRPEEDLEILHNLHVFKELGYPLFIGLSRKSFMQKILHKPASALLSTTVALNTMCAREGVAFLRVHDVAEHKDMLTLLERVDGVCKYPSSGH